MYTISASINGEATHLDSILFENLDNQTRFLVSDLPFLPAYDVDLSLQLLVTSINQIDLPLENSFRLIRNTPGELMLQFMGHVPELARLTVYNMSGQMVLDRKLPAISPMEVITLTIPGAGMYVPGLETRHGMVHYKMLGSASGMHNAFSLSVMPSHFNGTAPTAPFETQTKSAALDNDFRYEMGDSLRVSAFLDGYYTQPHGGRITGSRNISFTMLPVVETGTFTDSRDEQDYTWVRIGDQVWMAENLRYLPAVMGPDMGSEKDPHYYVYGYDGTDVNASIETDNYRHYGVLYNWPAAMAGASSSHSNPSGVQGACPPGWHMPSHDEWTQLEQEVCNQIGNSDCANQFPYDDTTVGWRGTNEGNALKSCRQEGSPLAGECNTSDHPRWDANDTHYGTDIYGFSALPGGGRNAIGNFFYLGINADWWSATAYSSTSAWFRYIGHNRGTADRNDSNKAVGFSIRCLKD